MTVFAVSFHHVLSALSNATQNINSLRHQFKVLNVDARPVSTQVINYESLGYFSECQLVRNSMGK